MTISVFPVASTSAASPTAKTFTAAAAYTTYEINETFLSGGYTITTSPSTAQVNVLFVGASSVLADVTTSSGSVSTSITENAVALYIRDTSGASNTVVTITYTSTIVSGSSISGTLDTITSTQTYNQTGQLYVLAFGGGGGGSSGSYFGGPSGGSGGGAGFITGKIVFANTATSVTIGAGGNGGNGSNNIGGGAGGAGGTTSFGNLVTAAGANGGSFVNYGGHAGGNGSVAGGASNQNGTPGSGLVSTQTFVSFGNQTVGSGAGGSANGGANGGVGNIGSGGNSATGANGNSANGYASGGGGGSGTQNGGAGTAGILYVLRGF